MITLTIGVQDLPSIITAIGAIVGISFTIYEICQIKEQLKNSTLINIFTLETDICSQKEKVDKVSLEIQAKAINLGDKYTKELARIDQESLNSVIENWFNSVERLCFCIKRKYIKERDWKTLYRDYIKDIVDKHVDKFGANTIYANVL